MSNEGGRKVAGSRCWPVPRGRLVAFDMPSIRKAGDVLTALNAVARAVSTGKVSCEEGAALAAVINYQKQALEMIELDQRVSALEMAEAQRGGS